MQRESHLPSEAPGALLAQAEPTDQDISVGDPLGAVVADILLGDDDAHRASFMPACNSAPILRRRSGFIPPRAGKRRRDASRPIPGPARVRRGDSPIGRRGASLDCRAVMTPTSQNQHNDSYYQLTDAGCI